MVPDALLLIAPGCPHCAQVLASLAGFVKGGLIGRLEVINIAVHPEVAEAAATRSVPWVRIGPYELAGSHTPGELRRWVERAARGEGIAAWYLESLEDGRLQEALARIRRHPEELKDLLEMLASQEPLPITVRIGISAIVEAFAGTEALASTIPILARLAEAPDPAIRADAAHYLGLTGDLSAVPILRPLLEDGDGQVREIAQEALEALGHARGGDERTRT